MPVRDLEVEVYRSNRRAAGPFDLVADPDNTQALREYLQDWLAGGKWAEGHWPKFSLKVRYAGSWRVQKVVRI